MATGLLLSVSGESDFSKNVIIFHHDQRQIPTCWIKKFCKQYGVNLQSLYVENRPLEVAESSKSLSQKEHYCQISPVLFQHKLLFV